MRQIFHFQTKHPAQPEPGHRPEGKHETSYKQDKSQ